MKPYWSTLCCQDVGAIRVSFIRYDGGEVVEISLAPADGEPTYDMPSVALYGPRVGVAFSRMCRDWLAKHPLCLGCGEALADQRRSDPFCSDACRDAEERRIAEERRAKEEAHETVRNR